MLEMIATSNALYGLVLCTIVGILFLDRARSNATSIGCIIVLVAAIMKRDIHFLAYGVSFVGGIVAAYILLNTISRGIDWIHGKIMKRGY